MSLWGFKTPYFNSWFFQALSIFFYAICDISAEMKETMHLYCLINYQYKDLKTFTTVFFFLLFYFEQQCYN